MNVFQKILQNKESIIQETLFNLKNPYIWDKNIVKFSHSILKNEINIIAEIKKSSPSCGKIINANVEDLVNIYEKNKAIGISMLTEKSMFSGSIYDLKTARHLTNIPILRKDFIFCKEQILESKKFGASAVLIIIKMFKYLDYTLLKELFEYSKELEIEVFIEIFDEYDLEIAIKLNPRIIMVNSRNLENLTINLNNFNKLLPQIPDNIIKICASGIKNSKDILKYKNNCNMFLVGTNLLKNGIEKIGENLSNLIYAKA